MLKLNLRPVRETNCLKVETILPKEEPLEDVMEMFWPVRAYRTDDDLAAEFNRLFLSQVLGE
jgi:hypothetical protein